MTLRSLTVVLSCTKGKITDTKSLILPLTREQMELWGAAILSGEPDIKGYRCVSLRASAS